MRVYARSKSLWVQAKSYLCRVLAPLHVHRKDASSCPAKHLLRQCTLRSCGFCGASADDLVPIIAPGRPQPAGGNRCPFTAPAHYCITTPSPIPTAYVSTLTAAHTLAALIPSASGRYIVCGAETTLLAYASQLKPEFGMYK